MADVTLTAASGNWTVPGGQAVGTARIITVECWGGGGAGGAGISASGGGGGGGGGAYSKKTAIAVTPGQVIPYVCGAGGIKNNTGTGGAGQDTTFNTNVCVADGGLGGQAYSSMAGGAGGAEANCVGDASSQSKGGNGGLANITYGGGGGESGSFTAPSTYTDGNDGSAGSAGGAGGTGTAGYDGGAGAAAHGQGSDAPGYAGGGGGGGHQSGGAEYGGTGGPGIIMITYTTLESAPTTALTGTPNDGDTITDTTPALVFTGTDLNADEVEYEVQVDDAVDFGISTNTYYFDASDNTTPGTPNDLYAYWTSEINCADGSTATAGTCATVSAGSSLQISGTNAPSDTITITSVRARAYVKTTSTSTINIYMWTTVGGPQGLGDVARLLSKTTEGWTNYINVSTPSGGWDWATLQSLGAFCYMDGGSGTISIYRVEIEVTSATTILDILSSTDSDDNWAGTGAPNPFPSGNEITYTVPAGSALTPSASPGTTYYWRVRAIDPLGSNTWGAWSPGDSTLGYDHFHLVSGGSCALTGTVTTATEADIVTGGKTIILTLTGDTWVATVGQDNAITTALIAGIDSAQSEANGWDAVVKANMVYTDVSRDSNTVVTITLGAEATYNITATETITATIPASALTAATQIVASPTFNVTATGGAVVRATGYMTPNTGFW